ncbi:MAG: DUF4338 domain-containing protein [Candidatus Heimdallarchaeota archaeon]|nr:DUF4338 domain-containing protein [Candidatus Heimdallarchaeota archaeon]
MLTISKLNIIIGAGRKVYSTDELEEIYDLLSKDNQKTVEDFNETEVITSVSNFTIESIPEKQARIILNKYHYLPTHNFVGRRICYSIIDEESSELLAISIWSNTPAPSLAARDEYLGLDDYSERVSTICKVCANNIRFLILPFVQVPNLASRIISKTIKQLKKDWYEKYGDKLKYVETFVDPSRGFKGTCYLASSWKKVGMTKGYSFHGTGYKGMKGFYKMPKCNTRKIIFVKKI